ncbi:ATP-binding protein [Streptomyces sp. NPDC001443]
MNGFIPPALAGPRPPQYRMRLTVGAHSARHIRRIARSCLAEWGLPHLTDTVELALTELVANVVRHVPDRRCTIALLRQPAGVRVEVTDGSARPPLPQGDVRPDAESGRGLALLDALVDKWGVDLTPEDGKTVWFECGTGSSRP